MFHVPQLWSKSSLVTHLLNTVYRLTFHLLKQKHLEKYEYKHSVIPAVNWFQSCGELSARIQAHVWFPPQDRSQYSHGDVSRLHSHSCTFSTTLHPLHTRSAPDARSSVSVFITSPFTANKQPASRRQHSVISLHMASASYPHTWLGACHCEICIIGLNLICPTRWDLPANVS